MTIYSLADESKQVRPLRQPSNNLSASDPSLRQTAIKKSLAEVAVAASNTGSTDFARFTGTGQIVEENGTYWLPYAVRPITRSIPVRVDFADPSIFTCS